MAGLPRPPGRDCSSIVYLENQDETWCHIPSKRLTPRSTVSRRERLSTVHTGDAADPQRLWEALMAQEPVWEPCIRGTLQPWIPIGQICDEEKQWIKRWGICVVIDLVYHLRESETPGVSILKDLVGLARTFKANVIVPIDSSVTQSLPPEVLEIIIFYAVELRINMLAQTTTVAHKGDQWCHWSFTHSERELLSSLRVPWGFWAAIASMPAFHCPAEDNVIGPGRHGLRFLVRQPKAMWQIGTLNPRLPMPPWPSPAQSLRLSSVATEERTFKNLPTGYGKIFEFKKDVPVASPPSWSHTQPLPRPNISVYRTYPRHEKEIVGVGFHPVKPHTMGRFGILQIDAEWSLSRRQLVTPVTTLLNMILETKCQVAIITIKMTDGHEEFPGLGQETTALCASFSFPKALIAVAKQIGLFFDVIGLTELSGQTGMFHRQCPLVNCASSRGKYEPKCNHGEAPALQWIPRVYVKLDPVLGHSSSSWVDSPDPSLQL
ncbi:hypothetical protein G7Z17_g9701 [Cylindrodendrum hubeiense]|uniref:Uncharacterized protein n=1 Tax=Cylindrodendrum hubeiense TaxID=595255 RepID=A0A9P5GZZ0_9HYPO|nr:hypothetical protein G7Z17_g9701 [Cylindrodendrum hubeiense]